MSEDGDPSESGDEPTREEGDGHEPSDSAADEAPLSDLRRRVEERRRRGGDEERVDGTAAGPDEAGSGAPAAGAPLSDLADEVAGSRSDATDEGLFEAVEVDRVDGEALWDAVVDESEAPEPSPEGEAAAVDADERVVDKREYCQRCEHFSAPPTVACGHAGTDIVEVVDGDRFRVRDCPMVGDDDAEFGPELRGDDGSGSGPGTGSGSESTE